MGSTGPNFVCPWCGRKNTSGYAIDGINYPICSGVPRQRFPSSCMDAVLSGVSRNGVRAGAIYGILIRNVNFQRIHGAQPEFFLNVSDLIFGRDDPSGQFHSIAHGRGIDYGFRNVQSMRLFYWEERYVYRTTPQTHPRGMLR